MPTEQLKVIGSASPIAFETCDESGNCNWANATLNGTVIDLIVPSQTNPSEVRYCWGDAPICNLFSGDDVPSDWNWSEWPTGCDDPRDSSPAVLDRLAPT